MINKLHAELNNKSFVPKEGQRGFACSNNESIRCPSFGINPNNVQEDVALDYLASILVEAFLDQKAYEYNKSNNKEKGGNIRPSVDQRTSG